MAFKKAFIQVMCASTLLSKQCMTDKVFGDTLLLIIYWTKVVLRVANRELTFLCYIASSTFTAFTRQFGCCTAFFPGRDRPYSKTKSRGTVLPNQYAYVVVHLEQKAAPPSPYWPFWPCACKSVFIRAKHGPTRPKGFLLWPLIKAEK